MYKYIIKKMLRVTKNLLSVIVICTRLKEKYKYNQGTNILNLWRILVKLLLYNKSLTLTKSKILAMQNGL